MIKNRLIKNAKKVDKFLINYLKKQDNSLLIKPMKYGVISGGKKIRSTIIFVGLGKVFQMWDPKLFSNFKSKARKKSYLNRSALKWDTKFKKEGV